MEIQVPQIYPNNNALIIIDVQPKTIKGESANNVIKLIPNYLKLSNYTCYIIITMDATEKSMLFKQKMFGEFDLEDVGSSDPSIEETLIGRNYLCLNKESRSCFKSFEKEKLKRFLVKNKIKELHYVGFDINDCVLASAYDGLDLGYYSYVIEELTDNAESDQELRGSALNILRSQRMTNNSMTNKLKKTNQFIEL